MEQAEKQRMAERVIPPDLDPRTFEHRIGGLENDGEPSESLGLAHKAFAKMSTGLGQVYERERAIKADKTRTEADHRLRVTKLADSALEPVANSIQAAYDRISSNIQGIDARITDGIKSATGDSNPQEIRAYVRSLSSDERDKFLASADLETTAAILSAKPFLSGLGDAAAELLRQRTIEREYPGLLKLRSRLDKAQDELMSGWALYQKKLEPLIASDAKKIEGAAKHADEAAKQPLNLA